MWGTNAELKVKEWDGIGRFVYKVKMYFSRLFITAILLRERNCEIFHQKPSLFVYVNRKLRKLCLWGTSSCIMYQTNLLMWRANTFLCSKQKTVSKWRCCIDLGAIFQQYAMFLITIDYLERESEIQCQIAYLLQVVHNSLTRALQRSWRWRFFFKYKSDVNS